MYKKENGMKNIPAQFRDDRDRMITLVMFILAMFFGFIPPLIVVFVPKNYISESTYEIAKTLFNFELLLFLISLLCFIPIIGWIASFLIVPILIIWNIVIIVINLCAMGKDNVIKIPEPYKFM